jgi:putative transcriptional regulator
MMASRKELVEDVRAVLGRAEFNVTETLQFQSALFDIAAKRGNSILLIKVLQNVDSFSKDSADTLKRLANVLEGAPILITLRTGSLPLEDGVLYSRHGIPLVTPATLNDFLIERIPPLVFASPGGFYVNLDGSLLNEIRQKQKISLGSLAEMAGVSRKAIQLYCEGQAAKIDVALKLEEYVGEELIIPINPLEYQPMGEPMGTIQREPGSFHDSVFNFLENMGCQILPTARCTFDALTYDTSTRLLTGIEGKSQRLHKRTHGIRTISEVLEKDSVFFITMETTRESLDGVPVISRTELKKIKETEKLLDVIADRKK